MNKFYVYIWYIVKTNFVFYVGKGTERRCKRTERRNEIFQSFIRKNKCTYKIIIDNLTEDEAFEKEKEAIEYYKSIGMATANIMPGGYGGDVISHLPKEKQESFRKKMTKIKHYLKNLLLEQCFGVFILKKIDKK